MRYKQALAIGSSEGTIQCTYAILYDEFGKKLFALQKKRLEEHVPLALLNQGSDYNQAPTDLNTLIPYVKDGRDGVVLWDTGHRMTEWADTGYIIFDMPLVEATEYSSARLVPVKLLYDAKTYLLRTISSGKGSVPYKTHWQELYNRIKAADVVYVKPAAFNWQPVDIAKRSSRVQAAKEKLDQAKAILLAAGVTNIL